MGCNCGKSSQTIAQQARAAAGRISMPGMQEANPLVIGDEGGDVLRVRAVRPPAGMTVGQSAWVTGTGVEKLLASGDVIDITRRQQRSRLFSVPGAGTYTSRQEAERVAAALETNVIEVA